MQTVKRELHVLPYLPVETLMQFTSRPHQEAGCTRDGKLTADSFCRYYSLSASFMDDDFFFRMMTNMWNAPPELTLPHHKRTVRNARTTSEVGQEGSADACTQARAN